MCFLKKLLKMACTACKKIGLENCDCDYVVKANCVEYKGDKLSFESGVKNGSSRTLSSILESISDQGCEREAKLVSGDYEVQSEDVCKYLLLNGTPVDSAHVTYTIELPNTEEFANKTLIFKDISENGDPTGTVFWDFSENIVYGQGGASTENFEELAWGSHKVLHLTFLKKDGVNYSWVVTSPSVGIPEVVTFTDDDLEGNWTIVEELKLFRLGKHRQLQGTVTGGDVPTSLLILDAQDIPSSSGYFLATVDVSPYRAILTITSQIAVSFPGGTHLTSGENLSLFGVSWYVD